MAKGGNSHRSNGSRFTKPYEVSNSFVTKVASRVSDYIGGWFGTPLKTSRDEETQETTSVMASGDTINRRTFDSVEVRRSMSLSHSCLDDVETVSSPAKRFKLSGRDNNDIEFPISPIPSTSGLFQSTINHTFDVPKSDDFVTPDPGPSNFQSQRYSQPNNIVPPTSSTTTDVKANGTTDNHSDSSESTSGCSSLVPQSDRLSQSAFVCSSRKRNLEEKLKYARQLQQSRASMYLNRSVPVRDDSSARKKPSFDVTAYGTPSLDKSLLREKLINSPFYNGQTSYGGASAYRLSRNSFYSQRNPRSLTSKGEGMQMQVKPSQHGSTEDLTNMSHTAKKILEALEQFSTPVSDAKRIPVSRLGVPLATKRRRFEDSSETRLRFSTPISPLNPNPGPVTTGLNVPTVPDLLKLKRLERIQDSTAAARQVAVPKQEYTLPSDLPPGKRVGKIVTRLKDREKDGPLEKLEEVHLPEIPLPITTLPKFDLQLPKPTVETKSEETKKQPSARFKFSPPLPVSVTMMSEQAARKNNFTFSNPLNANVREKEAEKPEITSLNNFMSSDAVAKLKRKSINENSLKPVVETPAPSVSSELKTGSVMDFFNKVASAGKADKQSADKSASETWECGSCLIRNLNDSKICCGCKAARVSEDKGRTSADPPKMETQDSGGKTPLPLFGFGDKFKPAKGSWSCKECFVSNSESAGKCVACETPKPSKSVAKEVPKEPPAVPKVVEKTNGFGDLFKKKANEWECSVCMIRNKEANTKCAACETPKPGCKPDKAEVKFSFGTAPLGQGFKFGIDKADANANPNANVNANANANASGVKSAADSSSFKIQSNGLQPQPTVTPSQFKPISTSVGVFTFGIPPASVSDKKEEPSKIEEAKTTSEATNNRFLVTSTSGTLWEQSAEKKESSEKTTEASEVTVPDTVGLPLTSTPAVTATAAATASSEAAKPFSFDSSNKSFVKPVSGGATQEKADALQPPSKSPKCFFGSNSTSLETVSSSTTDFNFGSKLSNANQLSTSETGLNKSPATFQFKPFGGGETSASQPNFASSLNTNSNANANSTDPKISASSTSANVTTVSSPPPAPVSLFTDPATKITFGGTPTPPSSAGFTLGAVASTSSSLFSTSTQPLTTSGFNSPAPTVPAVDSMAVKPTPADKPALPSGIGFGSNPGIFSSTPNPFAATSTPSTNLEPAKGFSGFGASAFASGFGNSTATTSPFGGGFGQPPNTNDKPSAPFVFGASAPSLSNTSTSAAPATAPGVFTFGASKPSEKSSQFTFGQNSSQGFFGTNSNTSTIFGGFNQPKPETTLGAPNPSPFGGNPPSTMFGMSSAPATFESAAPKFEFGAQTPQQPASFQFGAETQPASAPAAPNFSLSVPQKFNFTGGQTPVFSAEPQLENRPGARKFIRAVRRTNRDNTRRPN